MFRDFTRRYFQAVGPIVDGWASFKPLRHRLFQVAPVADIRAT